MFDELVDAQSLLGHFPAVGLYKTTFVFRLPPIYQLGGRCVHVFKPCVILQVVRQTHGQMDKEEFATGVHNGSPQRVSTTKE